MKKQLLILLISLLGLSCKKESISVVKSFDDLTFQDIKASDAKFTNETIVVSTSAEGNILKSGAILFYKTNLGTYGKFKIIGIDSDYKLQLDVVNYSADGKISLNQPGVVITPSYPCNLDQGVQAFDPATGDFKWDVPGAPDTYIKPQNTAVFYVYSK